MNKIYCVFFLFSFSLKSQNDIKLSFTKELKSHRLIFLTKARLIGEPSLQKAAEKLGAYKKMCEIPQKMSELLEFMSFLQTVKVEKGCEKRPAVSQLNQDWQQAKQADSDYFITTEFLLTQGKHPYLTINLYHTGLKQRLLSSSAIIFSEKNLYDTMNKLLSNFMTQVFRRESIYETKVVLSAAKNKTTPFRVHWFTFDQRAFISVQQKGETRGDTPRWAPDGQKFVYTAAFKDRNNLFVHNPLKKKSYRLTSDLGIHITPDWLNPNWVLFSYNKDRISRLEAINANTGQPRKNFLQDRSIVLSPRLSPQRNQLAYISDLYGSPKVFLYQLSSKGKNMLSQTKGYAANPQWRPQGDALIYTQEIKDPTTGVRAEKIFLQLIKGQGVYELIQRPGSQTEAHWSPKGEFVLYLSNENFPTKRKGVHQKKMALHLYDVRLKTSKMIPLPFESIHSLDWGH
jgi:Tol biopolymer transport system component